MKVLYFARLRQIIGRGQDEITPPAEVSTVAALVDYLKARDERIAEAFADLRMLKVAVNQRHVALDASLAGCHGSGLLPACHRRLNMRLNVFLQRAGVGSRREAERLVADGRISVNGKPAEATTPVEEGDAVALDGKPISPAKRELPRLFLLNKPLDVLVTNRDHQNRPTVFELPALNCAGPAAPDERGPA